ncbi:MAG: class I SAM-dependent methyltransferase [Chloroflexi bacterium]|nr:class I SAM-dependent methyltransferase [Chloroflexota bacterium]
MALSYDTWAQTLSLFQYLRWRRILVSLLDLPGGGRVLDACTGTAGVALEVAKRKTADVVGLDLSRGMLAQADTRVRDAGSQQRIRLVQGQAESLPFRDATFDSVLFTFLLRYVEEPGPVLRELARVLRPGGQLLSLEFDVPPKPVLYPLWVAYTRIGLPLLTMLHPGWRRVGTFLGPSISRLYTSFPIPRLISLWQAAGVANVQVRKLSLGGAVVMWGRREAP